MNSRDVIKALTSDGWYEARVKGSHHHFAHPTKPGMVRVSMKYMATVTREGADFLVEFPDAPGCQTFGASEEEALLAAQEALEGWLEAHIAVGRVPFRPQSRRQGRAVWVRPRLATVLQFRWLREEAGWSQGELARMAGVSQQQIAKFEAVGSNPTLATVEKVAHALGVQPVLGFVKR